MSGPPWGATPAAGVRWGTTRARGVLAATVLGSGMAMLDSTVVNVALPRIGVELGASVSGLQWILDGYLLALAALILIAGSLGDRYGRRRVFVVGVIWFGVASLLCGLAPTTGALVGVRVLQGVGGALLTPGSLAILQSTFRKQDRARAIGAWSGLAGVATAVGPVVGGLLVQAWSWRLAFLINVPVAAAAVWLARRYVPESCDAVAAGEQRVRLDVPGAVLGVVGLAGVTSALVEAPVRGAADPLVVAAAVLGVGGLVAFVVSQARGAHPLLPPELFTNRTFVLANALTLVVYAALGGVFTLFVLQLQVSLHYSPTAAGLAGLPITVIMLVLSARSGRLAQRVGPRRQLVLGPLVVACGMLLLRRVVPGAGYVTAVLPGVLVFGFGLAIVVAPVTATVLAAAPDRHAGAASGVNNALARTGTLLAIAVLPAAVGLSGSAYADPAALTDGWRSALLLCSGACALGGVFAVWVDNAVLGVAPAAPPVPARAAVTAAAAGERGADAAPHPGECLHCGVEGPPTYVRPVPSRR